MTKSFKQFRESTSAYKKSLAKIADKKKKAGMSSSDQNKMGKLAALMKKQKREDVEHVDEGLLGLSRSEKSKVKDHANKVSDVPSHWDHKNRTFTQKGWDAMHKALGGNKKHVNYAKKKYGTFKEEVEQFDEARAPSTVKHKGKTYYQTGKKGKDMKTGHPSFEYSSDMDGDDVRVWYNTRTKQLKMESVENVDEALSHAQRIKASLRMKKMKARIKIGRDRAMRKAPNMDVVKKRAMKKARTLLLKKMTKGAGKDEMSFARRAEIEKRLSKKQAVIQRLAKKMIPDVRKADRERRANKGK